MPRARFGLGSLSLPRACAAAVLLVAVPMAVPARAAEPLTATEVIVRSEQRFRRLKDYQCTVDMEARLGNKTESGSGQFWFKHPRMLRLKLTRGSGKGSEVALDDEGQIRGHKRGFLSFVVKRLEASDPRLRSMRGTSMLDLDWGSILLRYHAAVLRPDAITALAAHPEPESLYRIAVTYRDHAKAVREVYGFDPHEWTLVDGALFEDDTQMEHVSFRDFQFDRGLTDAWFHL